MCELTLIDLSGKMIMQTKLSSGQWNVENMNPGLYQLKLRTSSKVWLNKIEIIK
ncbi:MAG: T9SS C-terminal target domain-containing protein [Cytophagales bacterium]|nr:MAG: T9SS C-terminal target domain-containing protein [Cytophagales bacterium]